MSKRLFGASFVFTEGLERSIYDMYDYCELYFDDLNISRDTFEHIQH